MASAKHPGEVVCRKVRQQHLATLTRTKHRPTWHSSRASTTATHERQWCEYARQMAVKAGLIPDDLSLVACFYAHSKTVQFSTKHPRAIVGEYQIPDRVYYYTVHETAAEYEAAE